MLDSTMDVSVEVEEVLLAREEGRRRGSVAAEDEAPPSLWPTRSATHSGR